MSLFCQQISRKWTNGFYGVKQLGSENHFLAVTCASPKNISHTFDSYVIPYSTRGEPLKGSKKIGGLLYRLHGPNRPFWKHKENVDGSLRSAKPIPFGTHETYRRHERLAWQIGAVLFADPSDQISASEASLEIVQDFLRRVMELCEQQGAHSLCLPLAGVAPYGGLGPSEVIPMILDTLKRDKPKSLEQTVITIDPEVFDTNLVDGLPDEYFYFLEGIKNVFGENDFFTDNITRSYLARA